MASGLTRRTSARAERPRDVDPSGLDEGSTIARHRAICSVLLALPALILAATPGNANATSRKHHHPAPVTTSHDIENETTGTIPAKAPPQPNGTASAAGRDEEALPPPFRLPAAPRTRMRDCGMKWQAMKMSGQAGDDIWRAFATHCLAAAKGPFDGAPSDR